MNSEANSKRIALMLVGACGAITASWLALTLLFSLAIELLWSDALQRAPSFRPDWVNMVLFLVFGVLVLAVPFALLSFVVGLICAACWHRVATVSDYEKWGFWVWLLALAPTIGFFGLGIFAFLPSLVTFYKGVDFGVKWWPSRGWRHLFGLANNWEREEEQR